MRIAACVVLMMLAGCGSATDAADTAVSVDTVPVADTAVEPDDTEVVDTGGRVDTTPPEPEPTLRVLFVGNSYTYVNDLPGVFRALGAPQGASALEVESIASAGARLSGHWRTPSTRERIESGDFDAVVLQGQSLEALLTTDEFREYAALLSDAVAAADMRAVWYATWARKPGTPFLESAEVGGSAERMTTWLEGQYCLAAQPNGDAVARVGAAWQLALTELPEVGLYTADGSHPTRAGTLLAACVLWHELTGEAPQVPEPPPLGLDQETADALCALAPRVWRGGALGMCGGPCTDLKTDPMNCGECGVECPGALPCLKGTCECPANLTTCTDTCANLWTDREHCGACDNDCGDEPCVNRSCGCPARARDSVGVVTLGASDPGCTTFSNEVTAACMVAAHAYCAAQECYTSGLGPTLTPGFGSSVMCLSDPTEATTYTELQTYVPACDGVAERAGASCSTAIHRHCVAQGAASGFGPVASAGDDVTVTCLMDATVVETSFDAFTASPFQPCDGTEVSWGFWCNAASGVVCNMMGHTTGFGPVEVSADAIDIVCVDL